MDIICGLQWYLTKTSSLVGFACIFILQSSIIECQSSITFRTQPSSQTVKAGSPVTLSCSAQHSSRRVSIEWEHNNITIPADPRFTLKRDGSLQISPAELDDQGTYRCVASVKRGRDVAKSRTAILTVEGMCNKPTIVTRPVDSTTFPEGSDISLRCKCRSSSVGVVRWIKDGVTVRPKNARITKDHRRLYLNNTTVGDTGNYTCYLTVGSLGTVKSPKLQIWVGSAPRIHLHPPDNVKVSKGEKVFLDCAATGSPPPVVYWHYVGPAWFQLVKHLITNDAKYKVYGNGTLLIKNIGSGDTGYYECVAKNIMASASKKVKLYLPVRFLAKPRNKTVLFGKSVWFHCNATGSPKPGISWSKHRGKMEGTRFKQYPSGALLIKNVRQADSGRYFCIATNTEDVQETAFSLNVVESNTIRLSNAHKHSISAFLGLNRLITCEFHGRPPITVKWTKAGVDKLPSRLEARGNKLILKNVRLEDAGQYICNGSNQYSSYASYVNVTVYVPMKFVVKPRNKTVVVGESVWFHCTAVGSPKPRITWLKYKQGSRPLDSEKYKTHKNGSLNIRHVQMADAGRYFCIAATKTDLKQSTVTLRVNEKNRDIQNGKSESPVENQTSDTRDKHPSYYLVLIAFSLVLLNAT